jgi:hypothetical protein
MSFLRRNGLALRGLAVLLTAYCVLASGRALVPGLCATLADLDRESCCNPVPTCCEGGAVPQIPHMKSAAHDCAFCNLVHTAAQPIALAAIPAPALSTSLQLAAHDAYIPDPTSAGFFNRRAPPLS